MWNPDQVYAVEQARRAELYAEAERERQLWRGSTVASLTALLSRTLRTFAEHLSAGLTPRLNDEARQ